MAPTSTHRAILRIEIKTHGRKESKCYTIVRGAQPKVHRKSVPWHRSGTGVHRTAFLGMDDEVTDNASLSFRPVLLEYSVWWVSGNLEIDVVVERINSRKNLRDEKSPDFFCEGEGPIKRFQK